MLACLEVAICNFCHTCFYEHAHRHMSKSLNFYQLIKYRNINKIDTGIVDIILQKKGTVHVERPLIYIFIDS